MKKIVFDARMYGLEHAGIGRYILSLLKNTKTQKLKFELILLVNKSKVEEIKDDLGSQFKYVPVKSRHYSLFEQIEIPWVLRRIKPDLVHFPHFNAPIFWRKNFVVTIHDLIKHYFTGVETTTRTSGLHYIKRLGYKIQINHALNNSKLIFVPSQFWKEKLSKDFGVQSEKILVTPEAVEPTHTGKLKLKNSNRKKLKYKLEKPYLVYTGSVYPHKNIEVVFEALKSLPNVQLGIACSRNVFTRRVKKKAGQAGLQKQVKFLGFVPDNDLIQLYRHAVGLVQPSLMEGFGLTGLEAMAAGTPVIASQATCLPEVYGEAALYFNPQDPAELIAKIKLLIDNADLRQELIQKGHEQVSLYSWEKTTKLTIKGYKKALRSYEL